MKAVSVDNDTQLGPAMAALNERQRQFVYAMFEPGRNYSDAARAAGYTDEGGIRVQAHRLAHNPKVQAAMREEAENLIGGVLPLAHASMVDILKNPAHQDHAKMIKHAQALAGITPTQRVEVHHKSDAASLRADLLAAIEHLKSLDTSTPTPKAITSTPVDEWSTP